jgi:hypothetical protein
MLLDASHYEPNCRVAHKALKIAAERGPWGQVVKEGYDSFAAGDAVGAFWRYRLAAELGYRTAQVWIGAPSSVCVCVWARARACMHVRGRAFEGPVCCSSRTERRRSIESLRWYQLDPGYPLWVFHTPISWV